MVSTHVSQIPPPYLQQALHQHHLGKFLIFLFVSLIFLSNLMKQLQYGCQQKLLNDFIMILLCFQHFQFYSINPTDVQYGCGSNHITNPTNGHRSGWTDYKSSRN